jgi:nucleotidyltransferase/DNA polymerase involved in DNA repair
VVVPPGDDAAFLAPLPAGILTRDLDVRGRLARLGITTVGQLAAIPRSALVARFAVEGARLHARANGIEDDPFRPRRPPERVALAIPVEPPVEDLEALRFVLRRLGRALAGQIDARGEAAGRARLVLGLDRTFVPGAAAATVDPVRPGSPEPGAGEGGASTSTVVLEQRFPEPTADAEAIERLLLERLARRPIHAPVERMELELAEVAPAAGQQLALFVPQANRSARLGWQLLRLAVRHGPGRVGHVALDDPDALLAEARSSWRPVGDGSP